MRKFLLALTALTLLASPAFAQQKKSAAPPSLEQISTDLLTKLQADSAAALGDATQNSDNIAMACYKAINDDVTAKLASAAIPGGGLLTAFQKVRDITRLNASPQGTALIIGCAPLVQDARLNFVQFFTNIGAVVLLKGILPIP